MGQNQRRPGFLRWGEGARGADADASAESAMPVTPDAEPAVDPAVDPAAEAAAEDAATGDDASTEGQPTAEASGGEGDATPDAAPFLRDLVGAMRGVAESSRETTVAEFRQSVEARMEELTASAAERAGDLRRRSELDLGGIGDWERSELERVRAEAEQRRKARRELLEKELAEHQSASDGELEALRARLADYEREMDGFFAQLGDITDPAAFVTAAKRMPPPPDINAPVPPASTTSTTPAASAAGSAGDATAAGTSASGNGASATGEDRLAQRLAQLDERLGTANAAAPAETTGHVDEAVDAQPNAPVAAGASAATSATATAAPAAAAPAATAPPTAANAPTTVAPAGATETSTAIVVKGLGSFGAITSFKQALERVDGVRGVTLSLGPTGDFVYRASHAGDFDLATAIRSVEGPNAEIEEVDGQLRVTIERPR